MAEKTENMTQYRLEAQDATPTRSNRCAACGVPLPPVKARPKNHRNMCDYCRKVISGERGLFPVSGDDTPVEYDYAFDRYRDRVAIEDKKRRTSRPSPDGGDVGDLPLFEKQNDLF
ncbi:MAG: hypothetical protein JW885_02535 [Deltaproteobacteria bacterium]|nr:hypothetical protein [Candidatus Zymogenaceae bacterium]